MIEGMLDIYWENNEEQKAIHRDLGDIELLLGFVCQQIGQAFSISASYGNLMRLL